MRSALWRLFSALGALLLLAPVACRHPERREDSAPRSPTPPRAAVQPKVDVVHGERRVDNYFWLRERTNAAVVAYLEAENAYTEAVMKSTEAFQQKIYREMLSHIQETDLDVPYRYRGWFYYERTEEGKQYPIFCRKQGSLEAPEQVTLDLNVLAQGEKFMALGAAAVSDDGHLLAHTLDRVGFREYTLRVKDLRTGEFLTDQAEKVGAVAWAADNRTLFYTTEDSAKRSCRVWRLRLGAADPELVFEEKDERFNVHVGRSRSGAYLWLGSESLRQSEWRFLAADCPEGEWRTLVPRQPDLEYDVDHQGDFFFLRLNDRGRNFRLVKAPADDPRAERWVEVLPHRPDVYLWGHLCLARHLAVLERERAVPHIRVLPVDGSAEHRLAFPEASYSVFPQNNEEYETSKLRYRYSSFVTPPSVYDYDLERREARLLKRQEVPGGYEPERYQVERLEAPALDGAQVPVSLVYRKDLRRSGPQPVLLIGYGAYGYPAEVNFQPTLLTLLDRGVVVARAHIRGGSDLGKTWHDDGRMLKKRNTFTDFIAVADFLVARDYTRPQLLAIEGGSAGGLLIGAVVNLRPELFRVAHLAVPFVDVINTMLDESLPLTVAEFEEWGNPKVPAEFE